MKILVTGADGQLGYDVCRVLAARGIEHRGVDMADFDITDAGAVRDYIREFHPYAVIHCAAYTAVDRAEDEPEKCWAVNVDGTRNLAESCKEIGAKLLYVSTDYVFEGTGERFHEVDDPVNPQNVYGITKLAGELAVRSILEKHFIVRTSWVFGKKGNNFVKTMLRLAETKTEINIVCDQIGSPTYTADLAPLLCDMIRTEQYGIYHATNEGICSWSEFAEEIFRLAGKCITIHPVPTGKYPTKAVRPRNSRMSKNKFEQNNIHHLPTWQEALKYYLKELSE